MNQVKHFKFILQYLEFSSKSDQQQYELTILLKRSTAAAQQVVTKLQIKNPERTMTICRLPIDQVVEFQQRMTKKDGIYADYNIKFLFYLAGNQLLGDCVINLAYFLDGGAPQDQKQKKPLTSTTDKRAALLFKVIKDSIYESQEFPIADVPAPVIGPAPQTARTSSTRKIDSRTTRARSQSPPKEFKTAIIVSKANEQPAESTVSQSSFKQQQHHQQTQQDNLTQKFVQLGEKFQQQKQQQIVQPPSPPPPQEYDNFKEITDLLSQQEAELEKQIEQLDIHIRSDGKFKKIFDDSTFNNFDVSSQDSEIQLWKQKCAELEDKFNKVQDENQHLTVIIRQQSEQLKKMNQRSQSGYKQINDNALNQSTTSNQEQYEKTIDKKNQIIKELSNQLLELEKNANVNIIDQLKSQIVRLEQQMQEKEDQWLAQERIYKDKIIQLLQNTE
ncbi:unnamed protein product (macronuclear) [Paramecium tetraurelia]|uniref:C2 NT-type domain-containing protein n=1 Tax=Paramecium tetraurelia TaxID=5888 RepID=A0EAD6_PARTE|nr:uncharacterized protein GSPATT00024985001 [Paramecium tetraurelia]CAK92253.1 unnamed protein product [Paramecium tetraurelia]|eukprot:XP_001459650.1 hypothetical protein (macronuclear) [Paramecium tetraurelia strain d4-2]